MQSSKSNRGATESRGARRSPTWPWNLVWPLVGVILTLLSLVTYFIYTRFHAGRGYTPLGLALGMAALLLILFAAAYGLRRRQLQERLPGSLRSWLWAHIILGGLTLLFALLHGGFWPRLSSGWLTFGLLAIVVFSGAIGRLLYSAIPGRVTREVGNLVAVDTQREIEELDLQIDMRLAGRSNEMKQQVARLMAKQAGREAWQQAATTLPAGEAEPFLAIGELALQEIELRARLARQIRYQKLLKIWRTAHLPATVALLLGLCAHIVAVSDVLNKRPVPENFVPPLSNSIGAQPANLALAHASSNDSRTCGSCHVSQYGEWLGSMHSYAQATTTMEWQTILYDLESQKVFPEEVQGEFCIRCHTPIGTLMAEELDAPNESAQAIFSERAPLSQEGVQCISCHLPVETVDLEGNPTDPPRNVGQFVLSLRPDKHYVATFGEGTAEDPALVGNPYHRGGPSAPFDSRFEQSDTLHEASAFCSRCHNVSYEDTNTGELFELQKSYTEWLLNSMVDQEVGVLPGATCQDCHMSRLAGVPDEHNPAGPKPEGPAALNSFDRPLPARSLSTHRFVGVDHPRVSDPTLHDFDPGSSPKHASDLEARAELLVNTIQPPYVPAEQLGLTVQSPESTPAGQPLSFTVSIANQGAGHNFPTGFAFARQPWLDITVRDARGRVLLRSGELNEQGDLVGTRCNNPTLQLATQAIDTLLAGGEPAIQLVRNELGLEGVDEEILRAGQEPAVLAVLAAQRQLNEAPVTIGVDPQGNTVVGDRRGLDGDGTSPVVAGTRCVVNLQTQLFTLLPDTDQPAGEEEAYVQTRVLRRFVEACGAAPDDPEFERKQAECQRGPAQAFGLIAGQRITLLFNTLPVPTGSGPITIDVAFRFRNYPPYFVRGLGQGILARLQEPESGLAGRLDPATVQAAQDAMIEEILANTVTISNQQIEVPVR